MAMTEWQELLFHVSLVFDHLCIDAYKARKRGDTLEAGHFEMLIEELSDTKSLIIRMAQNASNSLQGFGDDEITKS